MNIITEANPWNIYEGWTWTAIDSDTYDGPGSHVGNGATEKAAIIDLCEQMIEELETVLDRCRENTVRALNKANLRRLEGNTPETDALQPRGDLQNPGEGQDSGQNQKPTSGILDDWLDSTYGDLSEERELGQLGRASDDPGYDEPSPDR